MSQKAIIQLEVASGCLEGIDQGSYSTIFELGLVQFRALRACSNPAAAAFEEASRKMDQVAGWLASSQRRGVVGEAMGCDMASELFPDCSVLPCSKEWAAGDFVMRFPECEILVEMKNYSSPVPQSQVAKFQRDASLSASDGFLFVSVGQPIRSHPRVSFGKENGRPVLSLSDFAAGDAASFQVAVLSLRQLIQSSKPQPPNLVAGQLSPVVASLERVKQQLEESLTAVKKNLKSLKKTAGHF